MLPDHRFHRGERALLFLVAALGFFALNGVFLYEALFHQEHVREAMRNPLALAFFLESLLLLGLLAWLLRKWRLSRLHWGWFVALSLLGTIAFALPVALLWRSGEGERKTD